jgi:SSS family transporter
MRPLDWIILLVSLVSIVFYGLWRSRGHQDTKSYLLAGKSMPWYAMALSIMATQASAITFISTTGQSYVDGMRFVQFYFGLPIAMVILSMTAVPIFHRTNVYTAYEYLEQRFDAKTRALVSGIFLIQRGLAVGIALAAPAIVLTVLLGWSNTATTLLMGTIAVLYTTMGGIKAVTWTEFIQMLIIMVGLVVAFLTAVWMLPGDISLADAASIAGAAGKINPIVLEFDPNDRYNIWSGLLGGLFIALAYFGTDQSQVQRYLTGKSINQSRLSLLFNAVAKIPMQFFILFIGAIIFVFYTFEKPPLLFQPQQLAHAQSASAEYSGIEDRYDYAFAKRKDAAYEFIEAKRAGNETRMQETAAVYKGAQGELDTVRQEGAALAERVSGESISDTNYIFLTFVTQHLPVGVVGLIMAVIFAAAMSSIASEINSLATVSVIDLYQRFYKPTASDSHLLKASRVLTVFWGAYAVVTAEFGQNLGALIEVVNILGSMFYGGLLGVFVLAFFFKKVGGTAAFIGVLAGEAAIFATRFLSDISFLWYNVIGCLVVLATALALTSFFGPRKEAA